MNYFFKTILFLFFALPCFAQDRIIQSDIKHYTEKVQNFLDKEKALSGYYSIDKDGIKMFASAKDKSAGKIEFSIAWGQIDNFDNLLEFYSSEAILNTYNQGQFKGTLDGKYIPPKKNDPEKRLSGYKIAVDAGHIANDMETGDLEKKYIKFKCDSLKGLRDSIEISEGILTYATAKLLKEKLEGEGAEVFLTRVNGYNAFGVPFDEWLKTSYSAAVDSLYKTGKFTISQKEWLLGPKAEKRDKFREVFKDLELAKRAEIINNYKPDFTIIIHYNVDETNIGWDKPSTKNFNMTFVGGAFMKSDLSTIEKRFEFLRLLISDDIEKSILLSSSVIKSFEKNLNVKTANITDAKYLYKGCLPTPEKGVYCRNLQLPRYIHSPVVYGETLYQDNISECQSLNEGTDKTKNKRVQQIADAYFQGILDYVNKSTNK